MAEDKKTEDKPKKKKTLGDKVVGFAMRRTGFNEVHNALSGAEPGKGKYDLTPEEIARDEEKKKKKK